MYIQELSCVIMPINNNNVSYVYNINININKSVCL